MKRPFHFEAMWLKDKTCEGVIKESWFGYLGLSPMRMVSMKLATCQDDLQRWNCEVFGHVRLTLAKKLKDLTKAYEASLYMSNPAHIYQLREEIQVLKYREEAMWKQRSHTDWLKGGDQNSRYFHCRSNKRNKHNYFLGFEDDDGVWIEDEGWMGGLVEEYFSRLFPHQIDDILKGISPTVTDDMNTSLNREYIAAEVVQALYQMAPLTTPSPDSMSLIFYKSF